MATKTFSAAHDLATDGGHDVIVAMATDTGQTIADETITISKNYTFLRGPGRDFKMLPTSTTGATITIDAVGAEVSGMIVETAVGGMNSAVHIKDGADFALIENFWCNFSSGMGIYLDGSSVYARINNFFISHTTGHGIHINGDIRHSKITNGEIDGSGSDGIVIEGTTARNNIIDGTVKIYGGSSYGIRITSPALRNLIGRGISIYNNTSGDVLDNGVDTEYEDLNLAENLAATIWDEPIVNHTTADTFGHEMYHQAYDNHVTIDTSGGVTGTTFPIGTDENPVNNLADALSICGTHFFSRIRIIGNLTIDGEDIGGYTLYADRSLGNVISITSMVNTDAVYFTDLTVGGALTGQVRFTTCVITPCTGFAGGAKNSLLVGNIEIVGTGANYFTNCDTYISDPTDQIEIDVGDKRLNMIRGRGNYLITNKTSSDSTVLDFAAGLIEIDNTCVSGQIIIGGIGDVIDNSDASCTVVDITISLNNIGNEVWDEQLSGHTSDGSTGKALSLASSGSVDYTALANAVWAHIVATTPADGSSEDVLKGINTLVDELHKIQGLDPSNPMTVTRTSRAAGSIDMDITGDGENTTTVTRQ